MEERSEWIYSHIYPDARRPGVVITERLVLRDRGLCRWSRFLDTNDLKGVKAQGEVWRREAVKTVRFSTKLGDPSRDFSLFGERQAVKNRALFVWLWEVAPVLMAWLSFALNPLSLTLYMTSGLLAVIWHAFPWDGSRYVMSKAATVEPLIGATVLSALTFMVSLVASWWLRLGGQHVAKDDVYSSVRPHAAAISRWHWQRPANAIFFGLFALWCIFLCIVCPVLAVQGRSMPCEAGGCESMPGVVDGTCGVGSCSCGAWADMHCAQAASLSPYCLAADAPLCSEDSSKASGAHGVLLLTASGSAASLLLLFLSWCVNHLAIILAWKKGETDPSPALKADHVPYHKITVTFEPPHRGSLVFTVGADEDVAELTRLLLPEAPASTWSLPYGNTDLEPLWRGDEDPQEALLLNPSTQEAPEDVQWD
ncbi:unnamed protein product [Durusdinium trenchii]|uniref:Uncharacterized protein n=2 Tax=Durusdinium trenchii TaxID=1381693 RepID=A0ABP0QK45_9DINO